METNTLKTITLSDSEAQVLEQVLGMSIEMMHDYWADEVSENQMTEQGLNRNIHHLGMICGKIESIT